MAHEEVPRRHRSDSRWLIFSAMKIAIVKKLNCKRWYLFLNYINIDQDGRDKVKLDSSDCDCWPNCIENFDIKINKKNQPGQQGQSRARYFWLRLWLFIWSQTHLVSCSIWQSTSDRWLSSNSWHWELWSLHLWI